MLRISRLDFVFLISAAAGLMAASWLVLIPEPRKTGEILWEFEEELGLPFRRGRCTAAFGENDVFGVRTSRGRLLAGLHLFARSQFPPPASNSVRAIARPTKSNHMPLPRFKVLPGSPELRQLMKPGNDISLAAFCFAIGVEVRVGSGIAQQS
jgi:hypothetical protein